MWSNHYRFKNPLTTNVSVKAFRDDLYEGSILDPWNVIIWSNGMRGTQSKSRPNFSKQERIGDQKAILQDFRMGENNFQVFRMRVLEAKYPPFPSGPFLLGTEMLGRSLLHSQSESSGNQATDFDLLLKWAFIQGTGIEFSKLCQNDPSFPPSAPQRPIRSEGIETKRKEIRRMGGDYDERMFRKQEALAATKE